MIFQATTIEIQLRFCDFIVIELAKYEATNEHTPPGSDEQFSVSILALFNPRSQFNSRFFSFRVLTFAPALPPSCALFHTDLVFRSLFGNVFLVLFHFFFYFWPLFAPFFYSTKLFTCLFSLLEFFSCVF